MSRDTAIRIAVGHIKDPVARSEAIARILTSQDGIKAELRRVLKARMKGHSTKDYKHRRVPIQVYLTPEEFLELRDQAAAHHDTMSAYVRRKVFNEVPNSRGSRLDRRGRLGRHKQ